MRSLTFADEIFRRWRQIGSVSIVLRRKSGGGAKLRKSRREDRSVPLYAVRAETNGCVYRGFLGIHGFSTEVRPFFPGLRGFSRRGRGGGCSAGVLEPLAWGRGSVTRLLSKWDERLLQIEMIQACGLIADAYMDA